MIEPPKSSDFASRIHNLFGLKEQGRELIALVTKAIGCRKACLLFLGADGKELATLPCEPGAEATLFSGPSLSGQNPIADYLRREKRLLTREGLATLPEFRCLWEEAGGEIRLNEIELLVPLISRGRLMGILVLGEKQSGAYSPEDFSLLEDVADRVAVSMEKEYLREQLSEREEELLVINRSSAIITSLDIQGVFDRFSQELRKVIDVGWAAIVLIEASTLYFMALSPEAGSKWRVGERIPLEGTAMERVAARKEAVVESDLSPQSRLVDAEYHLKQGIRSIAYLPLITEGRVTGGLIVASRRPDAYNQRQIRLLEHLASQIALPVENSRLYAEVVEKARIDEMTGLFNRRFLDETMASEISRHSRYGGVFSLIILDLDSFKAFNDSYGHLAGDSLLREIGGIVKNSIRKADQAFRYGGDEFAVLLPNTPIDAAKRVAERVRKQITAKITDGGIPVTASLGLASWPADGSRADEVIAVADEALYQAKRSGGDRSYSASPIAQR